MDRRGAATAAHALVVAAVAHAEFINIHPFDDGNGRTGRALTSFLMYRGGWWLRGFVSAEQVFGSDVQSYYSALRMFGTKYPGQDVDYTEWVRWFLDGLLRQADTRLDEASRQRAGREALRPSATRPAGAAGHGAHVRLAVRHRDEPRVRSRGGVSVATAVSDLNWLVAAGHLERLGSGRATRYVPRGATTED